MSFLNIITNEELMNSIIIGGGMCTLILGCFIYGSIKWIQERKRRIRNE